MANIKKLNVLWLSGAPHLATGFSTVAKNILEQLQATGLYDFTIVGINHYGDCYDYKSIIILPKIYSFSLL